MHRWNLRNQLQSLSFTDKKWTKRHLNYVPKNAYLLGSNASLWNWALQFPLQGGIPQMISPKPNMHMS